jgi:hypothetical protein
MFAMLLGKLLVVGTTRNCGATLEKNVNRILQACKDFDEVSFYVVESDSEDDTKVILSKLESKFPNFKYISMGTLEVLIPDRVERIRFCRNKYIEFLKKRQNTPERFDFVLVADLDNVNSKLSRKSVVSCFTTNLNWDACFANQSFGYYDLYALRAPEWINHDIFKELRAAFSQIHTNDGKWWRLVGYFQRDRLRKVHIYQNMRKIPSQHSWIKVQSAFGGAAIYRADILSSTDYSAINLNNQICEHVDLNIKLYHKGKSLFINPQFINSSFNEYNLNRVTLIRYLRALKSYMAK